MPDKKLIDIFNNIKTTLTGAKTSKIDRKINHSLNSLDSLTRDLSRNDFVQAFRDTINQFQKGQDSENLKQITSEENPIQSQDQQNRIQRYSEFSSIVEKISYCKRALKVLTDNIIAPDDLSKRTLEFNFQQKTQASKTDTSEQTIRTRLNEINDHNKIDHDLETIVSTTLQNGDYFAEIVETSDGKNLSAVLTEDSSCKEPIRESKDIAIKNQNDGEGEFSGKKSIGILIEDVQNLTSFNRTQTHTPVDIGGSASDNKFVGKFTQYSEKTPRLEDLFIIYHNPSNVIKLESKRFRTNFGYLVFPSAVDSGNNDSIQNGEVDSICKNIISQIKNSMEDIKLKRKDLKPIIKSYLEQLENDEDLVVRYVSPNHMVHFKLEETNKYFPYGESIFDSIVFDARLLMMLKVSNSIKRATSAQDKRLISVETGLPREAGNIISDVKESMRKRKFSVDDMGNIDSIPSHISTFEDIYVPMKDGKKYIEFDNARWDQPFDSDVDSLKFIRDNIVANLMVPAPYLGLEENTSNRQLLTSENVIFTRAVISYQKIFSNRIDELFEKIYKILYPNESEGIHRVSVSLPIPKTSVYGFEIDYIDKVTRVVDSLTEYGIPQDYILRKYLPQFDWDKIRETKNYEEIDDNLGGGEEEEEGGGMGF